jgi:A/G-specific adenine glycosylase
MAELRSSDIPVTPTEISALWADARQLERALDGLLSDGLVVPVDGGYELPG